MAMSMSFWKHRHPEDAPAETAEYGNHIHQTFGGAQAGFFGLTNVNKFESNA